MKPSRQESPQIAVILAENLKALICRARAQSSKLTRSRNDELIHQLRVTLRRLRTVIRLHSEYLNLQWVITNSKTLRSMASASNLLREAQVNLALLKEFQSTMGRRSEGDRDGVRKEFERVITKEYSKLRGSWLVELREHLNTILNQIKTSQIISAENMPYTRSLRAILEVEWKGLRPKLTRLKDSGQRRLLHRTRIRIKRIRYLLDMHELTIAKSFKKKLSRLQDLLGRVHDLQVLSSDLKASKARLVKKAGYKSLKKIIKAAEQRSFQKFKEEFSNSKLRQEYSNLRRQLVLCL